MNHTLAKNYQAGMNLLDITSYAPKTGVIKAFAINGKIVGMNAYIML